MSVTDTPTIIPEGWLAYGDPRALLEVEEISAAVSTNRVYRLILGDRSHVIAKASSYGSFAHFRQDHQRIQRWIELLRGTRWQSFLAAVLCRDGDVFIHRDGPSWVAFYGEIERREALPRVLSEEDVIEVGRELAEFHLACTRLSPALLPTWKTLGSDLAQLRDLLEHRSWCDPRGIGPICAEFLREHCDAFLTNAEALGYHGWPKIPVLVDWNLGNFSVQRTKLGFHLFSRWDYDWFRIEPRALDFYSLSRIVSEVGDRTEFSYWPDPLLEPRFRLFLRSYHAVTPLSREELLFLKESYRFFLLNYVVREGEHFFRSELCERLRRETVDQYLPSLVEFESEQLVEAVLL